MMGARTARRVARLPSIRNALREIRMFRNWPTVMLDSIGRRASGPVTYELRNGLKYRMRSATNDVGVLYETWILDSYSPSELALPQDAIVLDVGAHVGTFAIRAAREAPRGHVYAFEPTSENFAILKHNVEANGVRVTVVN